MQCHRIRLRSIIWFQRLNCESKWPLPSLMLRVSMRPSITRAKMVRPKCRSCRLRIVFSQAGHRTINLFKMSTIPPRILARRSIFWAAAMLGLRPRVSSPGMEAALRNDIWATKIEERATEISIDHRSHKESKPEIDKACKAKMENRTCNNQIASDRWKTAAVAFQALDPNRTQVEALAKINSSRHRLTTSRGKRVTPAMQHQGVIQEVQDLSSQGSLRGLASSHLTNPTWATCKEEVSKTSFLPLDHKALEVNQKLRSNSA